MMSSIPACNDYAKNVLMPAMDPKVLAEIKQLEVAKKFDDPHYMELLMSKRIPHARYLYCPNGSHLAMYDDQKTYMNGVVKFIADVDAGRF